MKHRWTCEEIKQNEYLVKESEMKERLQRVWEMLLALNTKRTSVLQQATKTLDVRCAQDRSAS
jgi:hypothetical protein